MTDAVFQVDRLREDIDLEVKRAGGRDGKGALPEDMWKTYSAFANTNGGTIVLGVSEKKGSFEVSGIEEVDRVLDDLWAQLNNPNKVSRNLLSQRAVIKIPAGLPGRWVISIDVPRASRKERPVFIHGNPLRGTYKRQQTGDFLCSEDEVRRMLAEQTEDERDARILRGYTFDDLDMDSFKAYRARLAALKPDHPYNNAENLDFLKKIGGWRRDRETDEDGLTLAGLLMFGKQESISDQVPNYFVDYREVPAGGSKTKWADRLTPDGTWSGNLYDFYRAVIQRLFRDLKVPFQLESTERDDETPVHKALREALVNAIVHADYSARISILVVKAPDYFGFRNPGKMRIPIEMALEGGHSDCRNRSLQKMFSLIGLGEQAGSGIPRVLENWNSVHFRAPELWESDDPEATLMRLRMVSLLPDEVLEGLRERFGATFDGLEENERLAVATAQIEGFVTNQRMQQLSRLHPRDLTVLLRKLEEGGFLVHDGQGRGTTYRVAGIGAVDLADSAELTDSGGRSAQMPSGSPQTENSSPHLAKSSPHLEGSSPHLDPRLNPELVRIAEPVRSTRKADPETTRKVILELCEGQFLPVADLAALLNRSAQGLRDRFVKPLLDEGLLERRFPHHPNHEQQAYRTRGT